MPNKIAIVLYRNGEELGIFKDIWQVMEWFHNHEDRSMFFSLKYLGYSMKEVTGEPVLY